jgi:hypothetical protein
MPAFEHNHDVSIPGINSCQLEHWNERHINRWTVIITVVGTDIYWVAADQNVWCISALPLHVHLSISSVHLCSLPTLTNVLCQKVMFYSEAALNTSFSWKIRKLKSVILTDPELYVLCTHKSSSHTCHKSIIRILSSAKSHIFHQESHI